MNKEKNFFRRNILSIVGFILFVGFSVYAMNLSIDWLDHLHEGDYDYNVCEKEIEGYGDEYRCLSTPWGVDKVNITELNLNNARVKERFVKELACYNEGGWINISYDLEKDYNLSCAKVDYLNDHLIMSSSKQHAGIISGSFSGFLSYRSVKGDFYQWVYDESVATGKLPKSVRFHADCNNETQKLDLKRNWDYKEIIKYTNTRSVSYFSEEDFVMFYVNNCIEEGESQ